MNENEPKEATEKKSKKRRRTRGTGSILRRGGKLYVRVRVIQDGVEVARELRVKDDKIGTAKQMLEALKAELDEKPVETYDRRNARFEELADAYQSSQLRPAVFHDGIKIDGLKSHADLTQRLRILRVEFGHRRVQEITRDDVRQFRIERLNRETRFRRKPSLATVNRELALLRAVFRWGEGAGWLSSRENPFSRPHNRKKETPLILTGAEKRRTRTLSPDEETRLVAAFETKHRRHVLPVILVLIDCGLRLNEARTLVWSDVDLVAGLLTVCATNTKTSKSRVVPLSGRAHAALSELAAQTTDDPNALVFGFRTFRDAWAAACKDAGIKDFRIHDLRHCAATKAVAMGVPLAVVGEMLGHSDPKMTARYANAGEVARKLFRDAQNGYNAALPALKEDSEVDEADRAFVN